MKVVKLTIAFAVLSVGIILCLWAADVIGQPVATDVMKRTLMIVGVIGISSAVIFVLMGNKKSSKEPDSQPNSGPKF